MKVKPMIFNTEMVKALLDGRKTVTRRPAKNLSFSERMGFIVSDWAYGIGMDLRETMNNCIRSKSAKCPAQIGDLLYVRETHGDAGVRLTYKADNDGAHCKVKRWIPSIHMPRSISRITLKVTDVRIEKLNDLRKSDEQVKKEGFENWPQFKHVWESIYGQSKPNDYVWVIEFEVIHQNVDKYLSSFSLPE
ncbi:ASCH domain-containing protein [Vibrio cholerae]|uniref:ASCH domain-containing protein n=1 Tax=Vibrio cholerae TaxID=666 RepID=UPI00226DED81|nr:ASCH domain-containing protein [Vibrio cholerae]MCX9579808.1 ASCH domain-containing protein [Vibrio cholerae]